MERFAPILADLRQYYANRPLHGTSIPPAELLDRVETFLATGDQQTLKRIGVSGPVAVGMLTRALQAPGMADVYDQRGVQMLLALQCHEALGWWAEEQLSQEAAGEDRHSEFGRLLSAAGLSEQVIADFTFSYITTYLNDTGPNSAGRFILGLAPEKVVAGLRGLSFVRAGEKGLLALLIKESPRGTAKAAIAEIVKKNPQTDLCGLLCRQGGRAFEEEIAAAFALLSPSARLWLAADLLAINAERFGGFLLTAARQTLADESAKECGITGRT